jgi:hypothetical protein
VLLRLPLLPAQPSWPAQRPQVALWAGSKAFLVAVPPLPRRHPQSPTRKPLPPQAMPSELGATVRVKVAEMADVAVVAVAVVRAGAKVVAQAAKAKPTAHVTATVTPLAKQVATQAVKVPVMLAVMAQAHAATAARAKTAMAVAQAAPQRATASAMQVETAIQATSKRSTPRAA